MTWHVKSIKQNPQIVTSGIIARPVGMDACCVYFSLQQQYIGKTLLKHGSEFWKYDPFIILDSKISFFCNGSMTVQWGLLKATATVAFM